MPKNSDELLNEVFSVEAPTTSDYRVLARKYRPDTFSDLIGQDVMVRTLEKAFETGRISHAFMLTGVRGVGKTTTARLLARALNYEDADRNIGQPSIDLSIDGAHCASIRSGTHADVLELDAASKTGVADMRDLLENARYTPSLARYRVYIIDEVHMLSSHAFNALLKTLEEPPAHVKFIFATTEIRKVPVTILSRCQRFDLRRLSIDDLAQHLAKVTNAEGGDIHPEGLRHLARAAEGSVRDGLSLLDQALLQQEPGTEIPAQDIRTMLGLIDPSETLEMLVNALEGDLKLALEKLDALVELGAIPERLFKAILSALGEVSSFQITQQFSEDFVHSKLEEIAKSFDGPQISRLWKLALEGFVDLKRAPDPHVAARMALIRLGHAAKLPSPTALLEGLKSGPTSKTRSKSDVAPTQSATPPRISSFADVLRLIDNKANTRLIMNVKKCVRPQSVSWGQISIGLEADAPKNLGSDLKLALEQATQIDWTISYTTAAKTATEAQAQHRRKLQTLNDLKKDPKLNAALEAFPGAEIVAVRPVMH